MSFPRVLFVLEYFPPHVGGVESLFANLTRGLAEAGYPVTVLTLHLPGTATRETINGVTIVRVHTPQIARRYLFMLLALPTALRYAGWAEIIHTTTYNAAIPAWIAARLRRKPSVLVVHEVFGPQWNDLPGLNPHLGYGFRAFEWLILHLPFTCYVCVSAFTRDRLTQFMHVRRERTAVIHPALDYTFWAPGIHVPHDLPQHLGLPPDTFIALYAGRPGISKGVEFLIDAAPRIRAALPESRLVLILARDPSDQYARLQQRIADRGLGEYVRVLDSVSRDELPRYLLGAGCVVVPSLSEGFGYAAVEAASLGCPVVATSGHSVAEVVGESVTLVPPRDPIALADAIIAVARAGTPKPAPRRFLLAEHIAQVRELYASIVGPRSEAECGTYTNDAATL